MTSSQFTNKRVHFVGVSGIGMSGIAQILARRGVFVTGSDRMESDVFAKLAGLGGKCWKGHRSRNVVGADVVVYSPAVPRNNCELLFAREKGILMMPRAQMLSLMASECDCISISGSHGKSTTTWLVGDMMLQAGTDPSILVGANAATLKGNARDGRSHYLVAEVCESDGIFANHPSALAVVTNIDAEHLDYYASLEDIQEHFRLFMNHTAQRLGAVVWGDDEPTLAAARASEAPFITYGFGKTDIQARLLEITGAGSRFEVDYMGQPLGEFRTPLLGRQNVLNCLAAIGAGLRLGLPLETIRCSLAENRGVDRRLSLRHTVRGVTLWDDYGHHPTEIRATLEALRPAISGRMIVVFQPHRYTRTKYLHQEFGRSFSLADHVIVTQVYSAGEPPIEGIDGRLIVEEARRQSHPSVEYIAEKEFVPARVAPMAQPGDAILFQGAGDICKLGRETAAQIESAGKVVAERSVG